MKEVELKPSDVTKGFFLLLLAVVFYYIGINPWVHWLFYEDQSKLFNGAGTYGLLRTYSVMIWFVIIMVILGRAYFGHFDKRSFRIKVPTWSTKETMTKEIEELLMRAASATAEGNQKLADKIYDKIKKMNEQ